jgi:PAS domain S-box-containing protein
MFGGYVGKKLAFAAGVDAVIAKDEGVSALVRVLNSLLGPPSCDEANAHHASSAPVPLSRPGTEGILAEQSSFHPALAECEERFQSTFEQTAVGLGHVSADGRWLRVNQKLCDITGYSRQEIQELTFRDITHPADLALDVAQTEKISAGKLDHYSIDKRYIRKDGEIVWVHLTVDAVRDSAGRLKYCVRVVEDGNAAKAVQNQLVQAQQDFHNARGHLELVANQLAAPLTRCTRDLRYLWVNQNYAKWLQKPVEKIIGRPIVDIIGREAFRTLSPRFERVLDGEAVTYEENVSFDGIGSRDISAAYQPTYDNSGKPDGWVALVRDVTDRVVQFPGRKERKIK